MNMNMNPTVEQLRHLVEACDDHAGHHVLWVAKNGEVRVSRIPKDMTPTGFEDAQPEMRLRFETFQAGNDYVGPEAAKDREWISQLFDTLKKDWPVAEAKSVVEYIDQF